MTSREFAGLSSIDRPQLFSQIARLDVATLAPAEEVRFAGRPGWLVSDGRLARKILTGAVGIKSRPDQSRAKLGGVGSKQGEAVKQTKRDLLAALDAVATDPDIVSIHLGTILESVDISKTGSLTESLAASMLTLVSSRQPGSICGNHIRRMVQETWDAIEAPGPGGVEDTLHAFLVELLANARSPFIIRLRQGAWSDHEVAAELRAMLLAGWGSTAAAIISSLSLGVLGRLGQRFVMDEVLRLYPPSFMIARTITSDAPGLPFAIGDIVVVSPWLVHRNPAGWVEPEQFDVNRWRESSSSLQWYLPFGLGFRRCPASSFARAQASAAATALGHLTQPGAVQLALVEHRSPALVPADWM